MLLAQPTLDSSFGSSVASPGRVESTQLASEASTGDWATKRASQRGGEFALDHVSERRKSQTF